MFQVVKRAELSPKKESMLKLFAVIIALVMVALILLLIGYNPMEIYMKIIEGSTGTAYRFQETVNKTIPLLVMSLGIAMAFKMKFWNIGAEGQFYMGAFGATFIALKFGESLPMIAALPLMFVVAAICGGIWAFIPAVLKTKFGTSETLVTLMMNYVAINWISYLQFGPWKDPKAMGFAKIATFSESCILPELFGVHIGWIIALVLVVIIHVVLKYSKLGYEVGVLGENENTARYAGMNVKKILIMAIMVSGGLCGIAGMMQASAIEMSLTNKLSGGLGFTAIITAWLAKLNPIAMVGVSFAFAVLLQGGAYLQTAMQIPSSVSGVIQGIILFFVLGSEFFTQYSIVRKK